MDIEKPNLIFLDIEGVVVTHRSIVTQTNLNNKEIYVGGRPGWHKYIDKCAMGLLGRLCVDYNAKIVLTSTLRNDDRVFNDIIDALPDFVVNKPDCVEGVTGRGKTRVHEIREYMKDKYPNGVGKWVVIDDRALEVENFVWVNAAEGFSWQNFCEAADILSGGNPKLPLIFL